MQLQSVLSPSFFMVVTGACMQQARSKLLDCLAQHVINDPFTMGQTAQTSRANLRRFMPVSKWQPPVLVKVGGKV